MSQFVQPDDDDDEQLADRSIGTISMEEAVQAAW